MDKVRKQGVEPEAIKPRVNQNKNLTVHMIPHTHDDVGWLKTYTDYFTGQSWADRNPSSVEDILDAVVFELL